MKIACAVGVLVVAGCAAPQNAANDPLGARRPISPTTAPAATAATISPWATAVAAVVVVAASVAAAAAVVARRSRIWRCPQTWRCPPISRCRRPPTWRSRRARRRRADVDCVVYPQCGCPASQACDVNTTNGNGVCVAPGPTADWNSAPARRQCKKGSTLRPRRLLAVLRRGRYAVGGLRRRNHRVLSAPGYEPEQHPQRQGLLAHLRSDQPAPTRPASSRAAPAPTASPTATTTRGASGRRRRRARRAQTAPTRRSPPMPRCARPATTVCPVISAAPAIRCARSANRAARERRRAARSRR